MSTSQKLEKKDRPYSVVPYDKEWAEKYKQEQKIITDIFENISKSIEHIGSTSVEGMWAKPQIDILVIVDDLRLVDNLIAKMEAEGYTYQEDFNKYNERYFTRDASSGERLVSVHVMQLDNPEAQSNIYLRNYLRVNPQERELYSKVKREAYESGANRAEYPIKKKEVLLGLLERAKEWNCVK